MVELVAPAVNPPVALVAPTGDDDTVWKEIMGVLTRGTNGAQP
jgi:hypothetical protein